MAFDPRDVPEFVAFVRAEAQGIVATVSPSGAPEAALVGIAALDDGTLVFDTLVGSRKAENLRHDHRIAVVIGTDGVSVQIDRFGTIVHGTLREEYGGAYNAQFPGSRALDPPFAVLVVVRPAWVRVYDASGAPARVTQARW